MSAYRDSSTPDGWPERLTTSDTLPGMVVEKHLGVVWDGVSTRTSQISGTSVGEVALGKALVEIVEAAEARGANAVTGLRFSTLDAHGGSVLAYGNAVWVTSSH